LSHHPFPLFLSIPPLLLLPPSSSASSFPLLHSWIIRHICSRTAGLQASITSTRWHNIPIRRILCNIITTQFTLMLHTRTLSTLPRHHSTITIIHTYTHIYPSSSPSTTNSSSTIACIINRIRTIFEDTGTRPTLQQQTLF